ncbi:hypothetical protein RIF29_22370 [Crotalaria pallida]|uniref:DUF3511 domain protein n=1 Tax=Crotalaria pallida TaxID=3830 RepID=A0AAN9F4H7_CROPI
MCAAPIYIKTSSISAHSLISSNHHPPPYLSGRSSSMDGYGYGSGQRSKIVSGKCSYGSSQKYGSDLGTSSPSEVTRASHGGGAVGKPWSFGDPEAKRKKRIARYKVYAVEGKVKATLRNGIRWIKDKCSRIVHGY